MADFASRSPAFRNHSPSLSPHAQASPRNQRPPPIRTSTHSSYNLAPISPAHERAVVAVVSPRNRQLSKKNSKPSKLSRNGAPRLVVNQPHRVQPPPFMNAPARSGRSPDEPTASSSLRHSMMALIQDYGLRANACKRAGRRRAEANAYYSMGVCYDNLAHYGKSIACYKAFAEVLLTSEDKFAQALAHNCVGVAYQNLAKRLDLMSHSDPAEKRAGDEAGDGPGQKRRQYLQLALQHHKQHGECADGPGRFLAHNNMGLVYQSLDDLAHAAEQHQHALRSAISMSSLAGQSVALGNLGLTAMSGQDLSTAKACMERHLQLTSNLGDSTGEVNALRMLGEIASQQGQHEEASELFMESVSSPAGAQEDASKRNNAKVKVGIARANAQMERKMQELSAQMQQQLTVDTDRQPEVFEQLNYIESPRRGIAYNPKSFQ